MDISTAAVVGAGTMGSGIAQKLASEGNTVLLVERHGFGRSDARG